MFHGFRKYFEEFDTFFCEKNILSVPTAKKLYCVV